MKKEKQATLDVLGREIVVLSSGDEDYISLTDMVRGFDGGPALIEQWLKNKDTILFLGVWETLHNPDFKTPEFEGFKIESGRNSFYMSVKKWTETTNGRGLISKPGRHGSGTFAHKDIAFEFGSWLSPEFKLYLIKDFQRLKTEESLRESQEWSLNRTLAKLNYRVQTDAVKKHLIPPTVTAEQAGYIYAQEADVLNMAMFGQTAADWRRKHGKNSNIRESATIDQLLVLTNLEATNAVFIGMGLAQADRVQRLNALAKEQMKALEGKGLANRLSQSTSQPALPDGNPPSNQ